MARLIIVLLALVAVCSLLLQSALSNKVVRVALRRAISMQGGSHGQPLVSYFVRTEFGTPAKPFNLLVDLNGREVWVPHYSRMGLVYMRLNYKNGYKKQDSSTGLKEPNESYKIDYNGCELSGKAYRDAVAFKDVVQGVQPVKFEQRFLAMSSASNDIFSKYSSVDGVLALSPWPISETLSDLITVSMKRANLTSELKFGLDLNSDLENGTGDNGGELSIGGFDSHKFMGDLRYHPLLHQHSWQVGLQMVMLGSNSMDACSNTQGGLHACTAVLSTTTNDIIGPAETIKSLLKLLDVENVDERSKESSINEISCLKVASAPTLTFVIDGSYYSIPPTSYIKEKVDGFIFKSSTCYIGLLANAFNNRWELGTSFLSNFYTVYDLDKGLIAFGKKK